MIWELGHTYESWREAIEEINMIRCEICVDCTKRVGCGLIPYTSYPGKQLYCDSKETIMKLADLKPGDIFEYAVQDRHWRTGTFAVLNMVSCYVRDWFVEGLVMVNHLDNGMVSRHRDNRQVILLSKSGEKIMSTDTKENMDYFIGWKFGVPVKVIQRESDQRIEGLLIQETEDAFYVLAAGTYTTIYSKAVYRYELIPYRPSDMGNSVRYPVCTTPKSTAYCNNVDRMEFMSSAYQPMIRIPDPPTVTLTIDNKKIELSQETIANLIKELGV